MKKLSKLLVIALAVAMCLTGLCACGGNVARETYTFREVTFRTIEQGKLGTGGYNILTLSSDGSFELTVCNDTYYSSDNGESYNPVSMLCATIYGKYEVTNEDKDLGDKTVKITEVSAVVIEDVKYEGETLSKLNAYAATGSTGLNESLVGKEVIVDKSHGISEKIIMIVVVDKEA